MRFDEPSPTTLARLLTRHDEDAFRDLLEDAATNGGVDIHLVERDYWMCQIACRAGGSAQGAPTLGASEADAACDPRPQVRKVEVDQIMPEHAAGSRGTVWAIRDR